MSRPKNAGQRVDEAQAFERDRERAFRAAECEYQNFARNISKITDEGILANLETILKEKEATVETARKAWLLARTQTQQTSEITSDIREQIDFTKQVLAVWNTASVDDRRTVIDWWVDSILVKPGRKEGARRKGEETVLVVALRSNPEKPKAVRMVQAIEARSPSPTPRFESARSSRTSSLIQQFRVAVRT